MSAQSNLSANVRALREAASMSQVDLARAMRERGRTGWQQVTVHRTEFGFQYTKIDDACALAEIFEVPLDQLIADAAPPESALASAKRIHETKIRSQITKLRAQLSGDR